MLKSIKSRLTNFASNTEGNITLEAVIFVPFLLTLLTATFSYFDAFRFKTLNTKAAYTVSDALSRQTDAVTAEFLDGMVETMKFLTRSENQYSLRVTTVQFDADENKHLIKWSEGRGKFIGMGESELTTLVNQLPKMLDNETVIVVETHTSYAPPFVTRGFVTDDLFYNFTVARPRFAPQLIWADTLDAEGAV